MRDELIELYVELEDIGRRLSAMKRRVAQQIGQREVRVEKILDAVRESDEAAANFGQDCGILSAPSDQPVAIAPLRVPRERRLNERHECGTHECCIPEDEIDHIAACGE
jgi:hypothetical protein